MVAGTQLPAGPRLVFAGLVLGSPGSCPEPEPVAVGALPSQAQWRGGGRAAATPTSFWRWTNGVGLGQKDYNKGRPAKEGQGRNGGSPLRWSRKRQCELALRHGRGTAFGDEGAPAHTTQGASTSVDDYTVGVPLEVGCFLRWGVADKGAGLSSP